MIIADSLSISLYRELLFKKDKSDTMRNVYYLEPPKNVFKILKDLVSFIFRIKFVEIPFFTGDFTTSSNENLWISTRIDTNISIVKKCENIVKTNNYYKLLLENYDIANVLKVMSTHLQNYCFKNALNNQIVKKSQLEYKKDIIYYSNFPKILAQNQLGRTVFLESTKIAKDITKILFVAYVIQYTLICFLLAFIFRSFLGSFKNVIEKEIIDAPYKVLTQSEGPVLSNQGLRTYPFWNTQKTEKKAILTILFENNTTTWFSKSIIQGTNKVIILPRWLLLCYVLNSFSKIKNELQLLIKACWNSCELFELEVNLRLLKVLINSFCISEFCKKTGIKVAIAAENYLLDSISFGFCRNISGLKYFSYQYSCRDGVVPPAMLANCDIFFSFARIFNQFWEKTKIKPQKFMSFGYFFSGDRQLVKKDSKKIKKMICKQKIKSIICYFDESISFEKYGLIKLKDFINDISIILSLCKKNRDYGLVLKPQFITNSIFTNKCIRSILKCEQPIQHLFELIFCHKKSNRNLVLPMQAVEVSSFVISHSFSATAGMEAALLNKPTFLLNTFIYKGKIWKIFFKNGLLYESLSCIIKVLTKTSKEKTISENAKKWRNVFRELKIEQNLCASDKFYKFLLSQA